MYLNTYKCNKGHLTEELSSLNASARSCRECGARTMAPKVKSEEVGECEACRQPDELDWECPEEPHHGEEAECDGCGAQYYSDFSGEIYAINEQAKKNFPQLKTL